MAVSRAWQYRFPVRMRCGHIVVFSGTAPWPGEHVWCTRCDGGSQVAVHYYDPSVPNGHCGLQAGDGRDELRCTLPRNHDGDKHFDEPESAWFAADGPLRASREGSCA